MEAYKQLVNGQSDKHLSTSPHKDKLLQTKLREKEIKETLKQQEKEKKQAKEEVRLESRVAAFSTPGLADVAGQHSVHNPMLCSSFRLTSNLAGKITCTYR
jgi:hypothetical protein